MEGLKEAESEYDRIDPASETEADRQARYAIAWGEKLSVDAATDQYIEATRERSAREEAIREDEDRAIHDIFRLGREVLSYSGVQGEERTAILVLLAHGRDNDPLPFNPDRDPIDDSIDSRIARATWLLGVEPKIARATSVVKRHLPSAASPTPSDTRPLDLRSNSPADGANETWSRPMSKTDMRVRLGNLTPRKFAAYVKDHPVRMVGNNRQTWSIRLDKMDGATRARFR